ncbi:3-phosphoshikimate 1-carboxyvinyltransferase [Robiginitalea biformata]|uniref:3-phosphoshikimate 1-carboxyvinyltransferase n=1 Tax=Robiginitalea biformata (strain ATCC BAA-864 / DSM 15991 / KCTC 12146 / HTCC2501) TaxID=313596 RepID=A4CPP0_ROBBH|nr:3-phosphoshikimate 1-carboxyvinyltransferase [Robiginitalea biformata]EAR14361.1 3-phosphoshikimate 1-carboxyvinyltransferase [Robiginitalea biformata HTCC2501]
MDLQISGPRQQRLQQDITITGSKSESNRLLLLRALYPGIEIRNLSNSDDARVMQNGLASGADTVDIHHAGTAMRFLTAYFASREGREVTLTGSQRMKERPIEILVEALRDLGAEIDYLENPGCPPLRIRGKRLEKSEVTLPAHVSSQYISALLLIAPSLPNGLTLHLEGTITSVPYIRMTLGLLDRLGVKTEFRDQTIRVEHAASLPESICTVESDWSSASYFYSLVALSPTGSQIGLRSFRGDSLQGDSVLPEIFGQLGVESHFEDDRLEITRSGDPDSDFFRCDLIRSPDLAQTLAACCFGLGIGCELTGLHTLKIKETDRLVALENELKKLGAEIRVTDKSLHLEPSRRIVAMQRIRTYNDHRMAMAFAPLGLKTDLVIEDAGVVSKSYPDFWEDLEALGFSHLEV